MSTPDAGLNEFSARLATFQTPHHLNKRRASNQTKKKGGGGGGGNTVEWPHEYPSAEGVMFYPINQYPHDMINNTDNPFSNSTARTRWILLQTRPRLGR